MADTHAIRVYVTGKKVEQVRGISNKIIALAYRNRRLVPLGLLRRFCRVCVPHDRDGTIIHALDLLQNAWVGASVVFNIGAGGARAKYGARACLERRNGVAEGMQERRASTAATSAQPGVRGRSSRKIFGKGGEGALGKPVATGPGVQAFFDVGRGAGV